ncbi:MAG: LysR family transcriptional regulator [Planctomycetota bacterium]
MEFDHLKGFYFVAKLGSFTEAASRLYLTQPAISLQVKALEKEVGERLFDRVGRTIRLTPAGSVIFKHVEELIGKLNEIQRVVGEIKNLECGRVDLGASDTTSMYVLPGLIEAFRSAHPKVDVSIVSLFSLEVTRKVLDREVDLGIVTIAEVPEVLATVPLYRQRFVCIAAKAHPLAARKLVSAKDLASSPIIGLSKHSLTRRQVDGYLAQAGASCTPFLELSNFEIVKSYVAAGLGVALVPEVAVEGCSDRFSIVALEEAPSVQLGIVYRKDREFSRPARTFLAMAEEYFRNLRKPARRVPQLA